MSLATRNLVPEWMDDPNLDPTLHRQALAGLRRIHWWSGTASGIANTLLELAQRSRLREIRILDVGCGGGDVTAQVGAKLAPHIPCSLTGWDISTTAIETASRHCEPTHVRSNGRCRLEFEVRNILDPDIHTPSAEAAFDFAYCSLFLHHFDNEQALNLVRRMMQWTRHAVLVDDLIRSRKGWLLAVAGCRLLSRSRIVHFDGPQSVRAAFSVQEMGQIAVQAQVADFEIRRLWPARFQWIGHHSSRARTGATS